MNVLKSGKQMLRNVFSGRFGSVWTQQGLLSLSTSAVPCNYRNCTVPSFKSRTLQEHHWAHGGLRYLCQQEIHAPDFKDHTQAPALVSSSGSDLSETVEAKKPFYRKLKNCASPSEVLDLVDNESTNVRHISFRFARMCETIKWMADAQRQHELSLMWAHPGFQELCHKARVNAHHIGINDLPYTLLAMINLGVSHSSLLVQTYLRVIQEQLNQFDEKSLSVLSKCLTKMKSSNNVEALKQGLKLILEDRFREFEHIMHLQHMMNLLGKETSPALKKKLELKLLSMADKINLVNAQSMLPILANMHLRSYPLLKICCQKIAENIHSVPYIKLLMVLRSCSQLRYKNNSFLLSISDYFANTLSMWTNKQVIFVLLEYKQLSFCPVILLDAFAERVIQKPDSLALKELLSVMRIYAYLNHDLKKHRQEFLAGVTRVMESYLPKMSTLDLLGALTCLSVFEHFPQVPLKKLLQEECLDELQRGDLDVGIKVQLHLLGLCLRLDNPPLPPSVLPIPDLQSIVPPIAYTVNPDLIRTLQNLFGKANVMDSVVEEGVYFIDCVITLPEAKEVFCAPEEQSAISQKSRRIAVLCAPSVLPCHGSTRPNGSLAVKIRHIKLLGYEPCVIPINELRALPVEQWTELLKNKIFPKEKIE